MKRVTFIAYDCAGDICPYGCVYAAPPDSGPDALAAPKRPNWPCARARNTTTFVAIPACTAAAAIATAPAQPPPPPPQTIEDHLRSRRPSAVWKRVGSLRSLL